VGKRHGCQVEKIMQPRSNAGEHASSDERRKVRVIQVTIGFGFTRDWLRKQHDFCDWLENLHAKPKHAKP